MSKKALLPEDMNKEQLLEEIRNWETTDEDLSDLLHRYFEKTGLRDWCDVAEEGRRLYAELFAIDVEKFSPMDDILSGVAAQASEGMCISMAAALGWDARILGLVLSHWNEPDENGEYKKEALTLEEFKAFYEKTAAEWSKPDADR